MRGLESFDATVEVYTRLSARALEEGFRLATGSLAPGDQVHVVSASKYTDGDGISSPSRYPEDELDVEYLPD